MLVHTCSQCGKTFKTAVGRLKHERKTCKIAKAGSFEGYYCYVCALRFPHGDNFERHLDFSHGVAITGEGSDGRLGRKPGTVEIVRHAHDGATVRVVYRRDI